MTLNFEHFSETKSSSPALSLGLTLGLESRP